DPGDIDAETRRRNRLARLMALPIGTQLGLFDDGMTVATAVDADKLLSRDPYEEGKAMGLAGKAYSQGDWEGDPQIQHLNGWQEAQRILGMQMQPGETVSA